MSEQRPSAEEAEAAEALQHAVAATQGAALISSQHAALKERNRARLSGLTREGGTSDNDDS